MLRRATWRDCLWVWRLRNDPDAVRWSRSGRVPLWRHLVWWAVSIGTGGTDLWLIHPPVDEYGEVSPEPFGYVRVCNRGVSVAVRPEVRGLGVASHGLSLLIGHMGAPLHATIHMDNEASRALFFKAGFICTTADGPWYRYEYRPRPAR